MWGKWGSAFTTEIGTVALGKARVVKTVVLRVKTTYIHGVSLL